ALSGDRWAMKQLLIHYGPKFLLIIGMFVIGYLIASFFGRLTGGLVAKKVDLTLGRFLTKAVRNGIMLIVLVAALQQFGIDLTGFVAVVAALGFAIGMALQGSLSNFAAGVMLLVFRPFKIDDYISVAGTEGTVEVIDLFTTRLNTLDNRHMIVPNGQIFGSTIENYTQNPLRRVDVNVGAEYGADIDVTRKTLESAVAEIEGAVVEPAPQVYLMELADSSVNWQLRVWCHPANYWTVREELTRAAKYSLDEAGIGIPFPQLDVNVVGKLLARAA
ncbi:MAG: mechanosensitive ion channel domain-containing protein, partial [Planctomycetota bacterium]